MPSLLDLLGYGASAIILISLTMKSIVRLRWINAFGSLLFVVFAFLTGSIPVIVMNIGIIFIDLFYVARLSKNKTFYHLVKAERHSSFLEFFYRSHQQEITEIFGDQAFEHASGYYWYIADDEIAGLFAWKEISAHECHVLIDYVTPRYRDTKIGSYFFKTHLDAFREKGYTSLVYLDVGEKHWKYAKAIGFEETAKGCFVKKI